MVVELPSDTVPLVIQGNVIDVLKTLPRKSVQMVVTSPPYFGLRDYGVCGCSISFPRANGEHSPEVELRSENGRGVRRKADPNCPTCHGSGRVHGLEVLWGGKADCVHVFATTPPRRPRDDGDQGKNSLQQGNVGGSFDSHGGRLCSLCGGWFGQLGLEPTPDLYVEHIALVFDEVREVLRDDGTIWLNLGDSYHGDSPVRGQSAEAFSKEWDPSQTASRGGGRRSAARMGDIKPKDLIGVPWMTALALRARGWYLRSDVIWDKPNPMPSSVSDRPTCSHEYIFLLSKSRTYFYDQDAFRMPYVRLWDETNGGTFATDRFEDRQGHRRYPEGNGPYPLPKTAVYAPSTLREVADGYDGEATKDYDGSGVQDPSALKSRIIDGIRKKQENGGTVGANLRTVWEITVKPYLEAHFATFPEEIPKRAILLGTSENGACGKCGTPYERVIDRQVDDPRSTVPDGNYTERSGGHSNSRSPSDFFAQAVSTTRKTSGWKPTCSCGSGSILPCVVLDIFGGSGTTAKVARDNGRRSISIEINPNYVELQRRRPEISLPTMESEW